jgi:hypothetical protein
VCISNPSPECYSAPPFVGKERREKRGYITRTMDPISSDPTIPTLSYSWCRKQSYDIGRGTVSEMSSSQLIYLPQGHVCYVVFMGVMAHVVGYNKVGSQCFFLEYAGELRIIILSRKRWGEVLKNLIQLNTPPNKRK